MCYNRTVPGVREQTVVPVFLGTIPGQAGKGDVMEENMTDLQFNKLFEMVLMILDGCKDLDEAKEKIKKLLKEYESN